MERADRHQPNIDAEGWPQDGFSEDIGHGEELIDRGDTSEETRPLEHHEREALLPDVSDEMRDRVVLLREGTRLSQGSTYLDLANRASGPWVAMGGETVTSHQRIASKRDLDYEAWNAIMEAHSGGG